MATLADALANNLAPEMSDTARILVPDRRTQLFLHGNQAICEVVHDVNRHIAAMFSDATISVALVDDEDSDYFQLKIEVETEQVSPEARRKLYGFAANLPPEAAKVGHRLMFSLVRA